jgi:hypothetical protein
MRFQPRMESSQMERRRADSLKVAVYVWPFGIRCYTKMEMRWTITDALAER